MSSDNKLRHKEKSKSRNAKKKHATISTSKKPEVRKISEKYLKEELQIENSLKLRNASKPIDDDYVKQKQDEVDFFCDPFSSVRLDIEKLSKDDSVSQKDENEIDPGDDVSQKSEAHSGHSNESPTHLASTYIGHELDPVIEKFELTRISFDELELLFRPSGESDAIQSNDEERALRLQNDEGFFIPEPPVISKTSNKLLLLDRLHESGSTEFIDRSGGLKNFHKLIDDGIYRLVCDKKFTPIFVAPIPMTFDSIDKIISEKKFLKIFISHLTFDQHHHFTQEHHAAKVVEKLFGEYNRRRNLDIAGTMRNKLSNLREVKSQSFPLSPDETNSAKHVKTEEVSLNHQIKSVRQKLHVEEKYDHMVMKSLLEQWKNLKSVRTQQCYSFTNIILKIQKADFDVDARQAQWQQQYDSELNEMIREEFDEYHTMKQKYKDFVKSINDPESITEEQEVVKKPRKPDIDKIVAQLNKIYDDIPIDEPELNILLSSDHEASTDKLPKPSEKLKKIKRFSYRIELEIDNEIVGSTKHCKLDEDFSILIQSAFIVKLTKQLPSKVKLLVSLI